MPPGLAILSILLDAAAAALLVYWGVALVRLVSTSLRIPTARAGIALARANLPRRSVCVIIPAHNEESSIGPLIDSLKAQDYPRFSVVLCLDRCTDRTAQVARAMTVGDHRFIILEVASCPEGWAGKVNAVWQGVRSPGAQVSELLLFADADTTFHPSCLSATVALLEHRRLDLLSLLSTLTARRWFELFVQPAAGIELVRQYPIGRANRPVTAARRRPFANGQFMLFTREAYEAVGGHGAVRVELLEDLALARRIADAKRPSGLFLADGMLSCRMYDSWEQFRRGWKRIYTESARCKVKRLKRASLVVRLLGAILPALAVVNLLFSLVLLNISVPIATSEDYASIQAWGGVGLWLSALGLIAYVTVIAIAHRIGRVPLWTVPAHPVGAWLMSGILAEAARDLERGVATSWAGREYVRTPR